MGLGLRLRLGVWSEWSVSATEDMERVRVRVRVRVRACRYAASATASQICCRCWFTPPLHVIFKYPYGFCTAGVFSAACDTHPCAM